MKNRVGLVVAIAGALLVLYLLFKPNPLTGSTAAIGTTANPNVTPLPANAAAGISSGFSGLFSAIAGGLGLGAKTIASVVSANAAPQPLDPTAQGVSDALSQVEQLENDPISQSISQALSDVQYESPIGISNDEISFDTSSSPGLDSALNNEVAV